jgi:hypothetical protein
MRELLPPSRNKHSLPLIQPEKVRFSFAFSFPSVPKVALLRAASASAAAATAFSIDLSKRYDNDPNCLKS